MKKTLLLASTFAGLALSPLFAQTVPPGLPTDKPAADAAKKAKEVVDKKAGAAKKAADAVKPDPKTVKPDPKTVKPKPSSAAKSPRSPADKAMAAKAKQMADQLKPAEKAKLLDVVQNGDLKAVEALPGVGKAIGGNIIAARPISGVEDLVNVSGIGDDRYAGLIAWAQGKAAPASTAKGKPIKPTAPATGDAAKAAAGKATKDAAGKATKDAKAAADALKPKLPGKPQ